MHSIFFRITFSLALASLGAFAATLCRAEQPIDFARDIQPLLSENCFHCHGPDAANRAADLRLDQQDGAETMLTPGDREDSELFRRIAATDDDELMPPPDSNRTLTAAQIELLGRWIDQGAPWGEHWAFAPLVRPDLPAQQPHTGDHPIDRFVLAMLEREGIEPAPRASPEALLRRVSLDLTGLPPTLAELDAFLADPSPSAYARAVDRLLQSPAYGERMAWDWLDAARYADSNGYQGDGERTMWPWRDWVLRAYNANMPFDRFTIEQLAGDLLPEPTADQLIATGFNRNHRINDEDGIILEEFRTEYVADRVDTTSTVWLGLTLGCARCHDHKYDPITQTDYYRFFAYFNSVEETGRGHGNAQPLYYFDPTVRPEVERIDRRILELKDPAQGEYSELTELKEKRRKLLDESLTTMVMRDRDKPRETFLLNRGQYSDPGQQVTPGTPEVLPALSADAPQNRLGLARWIVDPGNPLTARVAVNRYWQLHFGTGLVATPADFGTRGEAPSHPDLLDWLATEFVRSGWDVKAIQRLIVTSATYRQSSFTNRNAYERDPENRLLARGPRLRLPAEMIRDSALAVSGLLDERLGGPPVKPYQPEGLWAELVSFAPDYDQSTGSDLYRRSLYTFIRRTVPPPAMAAFDLPSREVCTVRRGRTNTPLQALVVMNDPTYVEAARKLAEQSLRTTGDEPASAIDHMFRRVLTRAPSDEERLLLLEEFQHRAGRFASNPESAAEFLSVGETALADDLNSARLAALTAVASLILNLDEAVTRE